MQLPLICEICHEHIGMFDPAELSAPIKGGMFKPKDNIHGYPEPFPASVEWEHMRCRICGKRPFLSQDQVKTDRGYYVIGSDKIPGDPEYTVEVYTDAELEAEWNARANINQPVNDNKDIPNVRKQTHRRK